MTKSALAVAVLDRRCVGVELERIECRNRLAHFVGRRPQARYDAHVWLGMNVVTTIAALVHLFLDDEAHRTGAAGHFEPVGFGREPVQPGQTFHIRQRRRREFARADTRQRGQQTAGAVLRVDRAVDDGEDRDGADRGRKHRAHQPAKASAWLLCAVIDLVKVAQVASSTPAVHLRQAGRTRPTSKRMMLSLAPVVTPAHHGAFSLSPSRRIHFLRKRCFRLVPQFYPIVVEPAPMTARS
jgi:hypothetical protein